jgi:hypothetical protein
MIFYTPVLMMVEIAEKNELLSVRCAVDEKSASGVSPACIFGPSETSLLL